MRTRQRMLVHAPDPTPETKGVWNRILVERTVFAQETLWDELVGVRIPFLVMRYCPVSHPFKFCMLARGCTYQTLHMIVAPA